jgi:tetratricopeptide (TPR) repeat protein
LQTAAGWIDQALALYRQAAAMPPSPRDVGVAVDQTARLGEGIALRIRSEIEYLSGNPEGARQSLAEAQPILEGLTPVFTQSNAERYLAQTRQALGTVWQWRGFLAETTGEMPAAHTAYQAALKEYNACLEIGQQSLDRIVREDIVNTLCLPYRDQVKEKIEALEGGSG